jgi:hypothetical protein
MSIRVEARTRRRMRELARREDRDESTLARLVVRLYGEVGGLFPTFTDFERELRAWITSRRR